MKTVVRRAQQVRILNVGCEYRKRSPSGVTRVRTGYVRDFSVDGQGNSDRQRVGLSARRAFKGKAGAQDVLLNFFVIQ